MANSLGIYVGTENLDVVLLSGTFARPSLVSFASAKIPAQASWRTLVRVEGPATGEPEGPAPAAGANDLESIAMAIRSVLTRLGVTAPKAHIAVAPESVVIRYFQMPAIPPHERKMAIAFEAKKYLPFKPEELITDYQAILRRTDPSLMRVMYFGIKKSAFASYGSLFSSAGLTPLSLEPASISLARLVRQSGQLPPGQVCAVLSVERDNATISIAREDLLYLSRNVTILSAPGPGAEGPSGELLEALVTETRVSVDYYRRRFLGEPAVSKVILFGRAIDPNRVQELSQALDLPVELGDPFRRVGGAKSVPEGLWTATGLAMRGLEKRAGEINLLPPEQRSQTKDLLNPIVVEAALACALLAGWYAFSLQDLGALEGRIAACKLQQIQLPQIPAQAGSPQLRDEQLKASRMLKFLKQASEPALQISTWMVELANVIPSEAWIRHAALWNRLEAKEGGALPSDQRRILRIQGSAFAGNRDKELERINVFLAALRENAVVKAGFSAFSLDSVQRGSFLTEETTDFSLTACTNPEDLKFRDTEFRSGGPLRRVTR